jgi:hypothetical protein
VIHIIIEHIVSELNDYMKLRMGVDQDPVVATCLLKPDGQPQQEAKEKVVLGVVNLEADRVYHSVETFSKRPDGTSEVVKPDVRVNLYVLFVGNFMKYSEALKAISLVIAFFQHRTVFDYASIAGLEGRKGRIAFELFSPTFEQQNHLWGALGAKYMPSVLYKAGFVDITDQVVEGEAPPVEDILINEQAI